jgi:hypothetical protein
MGCPLCPWYLRDSPQRPHPVGPAYGLLLRWAARYRNLSPAGKRLGILLPAGGCQSFCLSVHAAEISPHCAFGGLLCEDSLLTCSLYRGLCANTQKTRSITTATAMARVATEPVHIRQSRPRCSRLALRIAMLPLQFSRPRRRSVSVSRTPGRANPATGLAHR